MALPTCRSLSHPRSLARRHAASSRVCAASTHELYLRIGRVAPRRRPHIRRRRRLPPGPQCAFVLAYRAARKEALSETFHNFLTCATDFSVFPFLPSFLPSFLPYCLDSTRGRNRDDERARNRIIGATAAASAAPRVRHSLASSLLWSALRRSHSLPRTSELLRRGGGGGGGFRFVPVPLACYHHRGKGASLLVRFPLDHVIAVKANQPRGGRL